MGINTDNRKMVTYFVGTEVENTIMKGEKTLFVVGVQPVDDIIGLAEEHKLRHLYFGTSQSFNPKAVTMEEYAAWDDVIRGCLIKDYWVTLDFGVEHIEGVPAVIKEIVRAGDLVITQGAGNVGALSPELAKRSLQ